MEKSKGHNRALFPTRGLSTQTIIASALQKSAAFRNFRNAKAKAAELFPPPASYDAEYLFASYCSRYILSGPSKDDKHNVYARIDFDPD